MPAGGSCLLGSLNLAEFVKDGAFDYADFGKAVRIAVDGLNDVLDEGLPLHPLKEQRDSVRDWRQIGLGIMGLADMLIKLGIEYGSEESIDICDSIGYVLATTAIKESANLAHKNKILKTIPRTTINKKIRVFQKTNCTKMLKEKTAGGTKGVIINQMQKTILRLK